MDWKLRFGFWLWLGKHFWSYFLLVFGGLIALLTKRPLRQAEFVIGEITAGILSGLGTVALLLLSPLAVGVLVPYWVLFVFYALFIRSTGVAP